MMRARFRSVDRAELTGEALARSAALRRRVPLPENEAVQDALALAAGLHGWDAERMARTVAADMDGAPHAQLSAAANAVPQDGAHHRLRLRLVNADEGRNYLAAERIADDFAAGSAFAATLGADLPVVEDALVLAAGLSRSGDWAVARLLERGGLYDRLVAGRITAHTHVSRRTVAGLIRGMLTRRPFDPLDSLQGGDWRAAVVRHLAPHHGPILIPYLERESNAERLALVAESWPEEAIAALVRLGRRPYPGLRRNVVSALASVLRCHPVPALDAILLLAAEIPDLRIQAAIAAGGAPLPDDPAGLAGPSFRPPAASLTPFQRLRRRRGRVHHAEATAAAPALPALARWVERLLALAAADESDVRVAVPYAVARLALVDPACVGPPARETLARICGDSVRAYARHGRDARIGAAAFALATAADGALDQQRWQELVTALGEEAAASGWLVDAGDGDWNELMLRQSRAADEARLLLHARIQRMVRDPALRHRWFWELVHTHLGRAVVRDMIGEPSSDSAADGALLHRPLPDVITVGYRQDRPIPVAAIADPPPEIREGDVDDAVEILAREYPVAGLPILVAFAARSPWSDQRLLCDALTRIARAEPDTFLRILEDGITPPGGGEPIAWQRHEAPAVRQSFAIALGALGARRPSAAAAALATLEDDEDRDVRRLAISMLEDVLAAHPYAPGLSATHAAIGASGTARTFMKGGMPLRVVRSIARVTAALRAARDGFLWMPQLAWLPAPLRLAAHILLYAPRALLLLLLMLPFVLVMAALSLAFMVVGYGSALVLALMVVIITKTAKAVRHVITSLRRAVVRAAGRS